MPGKTLLGRLGRPEEVARVALFLASEGPAEDVLVVGEMNDPQPLAGEVRIRVAFSGVIRGYRPFGTAAEYTVVPLRQVAELPRGVPLEQGACLGIPGITAHRAVHEAGSVKGRTVLIHCGISTMYVFFSFIHLL